MSVQSCMPQDIHDLNNHKEYTLISTHLLETLLTDTNLNAQASKLWQILFNKARYHQNLEVKISYQYLADKLAKSTRTIARYVETLVTAGYLQIKHNFDRNGGQRPNTFLICAPEISIQHLRKNKDRATKNDFKNNETLFKNEKTNSLESDDVVLENIFIESNIQNNVLCETLTTTLTSSENDKFDQGWGDSNVVLKINNIKDLNNKKTTVVVPFDPSTAQEKVLMQEIEQLEKDLHVASEKLSTITDYQSMYDQMRKNKEREGKLNVLRFTLERLKKENTAKEDKKHFTKALSDNCRLMMDKPGNRVISPFTFKRLFKTLVSYGYQGNTLHNVINEIVFEVRFGSLIICKKSKKPLALDNAINIALKLIREQRWTTPNMLISVHQNK